LTGKYLPRIADAKLALALKAMGAVLIEGPKWCGKTSTAENIAKSVLYMQDPDTFDENMREPSFLMVLTATETAFQLENGVWVVPLGCLKN